MEEAPPSAPGAPASHGAAAAGCDEVVAISEAPTTSSDEVVASSDAPATSSDAAAGSDEALMNSDAVTEAAATYRSKVSKNRAGLQSCSGSSEMASSACRILRMIPS